MDTHAESSWPPPLNPVLQKIPAGLPASAWDAHNSPVASKKALSWLGIIPKREGKPNIKASASTSCSGLMSATSSGLGGAFIFSNIRSERISGTCFQQTQIKLLTETNDPNYKRIQIFSFTIEVWHILIDSWKITLQSVASTPSIEAAPLCTSLAMVFTCPYNE